MDLKICSTIGFERAGQPLLQLRDEEDFVAQTTCALGPQPPNFQNIVALNCGPLVKEAATRSRPQRLPRPSACTPSAGTSPAA